MTKAKQKQKNTKAYQRLKGSAWYCSHCNMEYPTKKEAINCCKKEKENNTITPSTDSTPSTPSTTSTPSTQTPMSYLVKGLLKKERKPFHSIGRGLHKNIFYIGTVLDQDNKQIDAIVTSDRKIHVNWGKDNVDEIRQTFGLNYRFPLFGDCIDYWWSNPSILKWLEENYTVDIKELFNKIVAINKQYMMYEDERIHDYTALDIMRSYFFPLFNANSRTYHHADPGSGKTNQLMIYRALSFSPISSSDFSSASIYRIIESTSGTILIDDFDNLPEEQKLAIIQHIRTNYKPFKTIRSDGTKNNRPYGYNSYSHLVFNNVLGLGYDTITLDRCITIRLLKHKDAINKTVNSDDPIFSPIRDDLYIMTLQHWKEVKQCYETLKIQGLSSRELEVIKPILTIAQVIDKELYDEILCWYNEYLVQERLQDLSDSWEFHLLKFLWEKVSYKENKREETQISPKDIADELAPCLLNKESEDYKKNYNRLCSFVGKRIKSYIIFKGGMTNGRTHYNIYKEGIHKILEIQGLVEAVEGVEGVTPQTGIQTQLSEHNKLNQSNEIRAICDFYTTTKNKDGFVKEKSFIQFIKHRLKIPDPQKYYNHLLREGILTNYSGQGAQFTGRIQ